LNALHTRGFGIVLGEELANRLNVMTGDKVTVITPDITVSPAGVLPRLKQFTVVGIFRAGSGFGFDAMMAFIHLEDAQKLFLMGPSVSGIHVTIKDVYQAPWVSEQLAKQLSPSARITNWTQQFGAFFEAVSLEKTMMFLY
jgi:ABC-type transport system, involved in lipoprotein release, permease component